jgi:hypothetical protein
MTVEVNQIATTENSIPPEKIERPISQQKVDTNLLEKPVENKPSDPEVDPNWRAFREARKKDKAEREAAERKAIEKEAEVAALKAAMEAAFAKSPAPVQQSQDYQYHEEETEDQKIERKVQKIITEREAQFEKQRIEREKTELPKRVLQAYPDYHEVVSEENGAYLEYHYPEIYRSLLRQPENFETYADTYKIVKKLIPNSTTAKKESAKADANFAKPKSISSTGLTQNTESSGHRLTEDRKAANWERMQKTLKGIS